MVDCRLPNALHREPPFSDLATAGAFSNLDLSNASLGACDDSSGHPQSPCGAPLNISISEIDFVDSFYQFAFEVASFFCLDHPLQAKELSISEVYDDDLGRFDATHPDEWLFPAFRVMPMGWSWSLWLCQNALVDAMVASEARTGQPRPDVEERVLVDHRPAPLLAPGKPILSPCADNAIIIAWSPEESRGANRHLASELSNRGFAFRVEVETARDSTAIGLMFDGVARIFRNKPSRVWRLYYAIDQLILQRRFGSDLATSSRSLCFDGASSRP